jgi:hypothetical protein
MAAIRILYGKALRLAPVALRRPSPHIPLRLLAPLLYRSLISDR